MSAVAAVVFDLGGVVLDSPFGAIAQYERELGIATNTINRIIGSTGESGAFAKLERGELRSDAFAEAFTRECHPRGCSEICGSELLERITTACKPRPLMLDALEALRNAPDLKTAALTNNFIMSASNGDPLERLRPFFDVVVESAVERIRKPDPAIYLLACERLGTSPSTCVFLDDIGRNLKPAKELGMQTIRVDASDATGAKALGSLASILGRASMPVAAQSLQRCLRMARL